MADKNIFDQAFEFLDNNDVDKVKKFFEKVLERDETKEDVAFGLFLCIGDDENSEIDAEQCDNKFFR